MPLLDQDSYICCRERLPSRDSHTLEAPGERPQGLHQQPVHTATDAKWPATCWPTATGFNSKSSSITTGLKSWPRTTKDEAARSPNGGSIGDYRKSPDLLKSWKRGTSRSSRHHLSTKVLSLQGTPRPACSEFCSRRATQASGRTRDLVQGSTHGRSP